MPTRIIGAKLEKDNEVLCCMEWNKRYDGTLPKHSFLSNKILKEKYPQLLLDYYESKLRVQKK